MEWVVDVVFVFMGPWCVTECMFGIMMRYVVRWQHRECCGDAVTVPPHAMVSSVSIVVVSGGGFAA